MMTIKPPPKKEIKHSLGSWSRSILTFQDSCTAVLPLTTGFPKRLRPWVQGQPERLLHLAVRTKVVHQSSPHMVHYKTDEVTGCVEKRLMWNFPPQHKTCLPLWFTSTRDPSLLGGLLEHTFWKTRTGLGQELREVFISSFRVGLCTY